MKNTLKDVGTFLKREDQKRKAVKEIMKAQPRPFTVIGIYEESGQVIADGVEAIDGADALRKAHGGLLLVSEGYSEEDARSEREGCKYILAFPTGVEVTFFDDAEGN